MKRNREANGNAIGHGRRKRKGAPQKRAKTKAKSNGEKEEIFDTAKGPKRTDTAFDAMGFQGTLQGSAKRWAPGCVNAAGKARQKW